MTAHCAQEQAAKAKKNANGFKLDKSHVLLTNLMADYNRVINTEQDAETTGQVLTALKKLQQAEVQQREQLGLVSVEVAELLKKCQLEQYAEQFHEKGFDDVKVIQMYVTDVLEHIRMKPDEEERLRRALGTPTPLAKRTALREQKQARGPVVAGRWQVLVAAVDCLRGSADCLSIYIDGTLTNHGLTGSDLAGDNGLSLGGRIVLLGGGKQSESRGGDLRKVCNQP